MNYANLFDLSGKRALVIGAGSGIRAAAAQGLGAFGAEVVCADLDEEKAQGTVATVRNSGGAAQAFPVNLAEQKSVQDLFAQCDTLDVLVCTPSVMFGRGCSSTLSPTSIRW